MQLLNYKIFKHMKKYIFTLFFVITLVSSLFAQEKKITGKVTDKKTGSSIPGVSVIIEGTSNGTMTDSEGNYSLSVPYKKETKLIFSYFGYTTQIVTVGDKTVINIAFEII